MTIPEQLKNQRLALNALIECVTLPYRDRLKYVSHLAEIESAIRVIAVCCVENQVK